MKNPTARPGSVRSIRVIGIGAGSPGHVTAEAAEALAEVDVFLVADKGDAKDELVAVRRAICDRFVPADHAYEFVTVPDPRRGPDAERDSGAYAQGVRDWHAARTDAYVRIIEELPSDAVVGFLVWGDPAFYDSTIRVVDAIGERLPTTVRVIPGISAFQTLAAAHGIVLHRVGEPVHVTTGRRLVDEWTRAESAGLALGTVVVMLDGHLHCREIAHTHPDTVIHWGAYVGMPQQELRSGRLADVIDEIVDLRARLREEHGWVMDVYALTPARAGLSR
ncbi:precorrin-6A synthase (deacetylating) [Janibacter cremeus]|uniref:precorrin-6A synthase (deacetylating) n=1 Tax=Janibacter cremeus TaxID=1285192 RepID=UPI0023FA0DC7|nr:precorrin-6A synthase (deacetylating) [Janibacter cremeus]WEV78556.1 precorrin-6A synthase (deacetylating) [Janibacter cremeus]